MKYIIRCSYCGNTYPVKLKKKTSFLCKFCGGTNNWDDILQQIDEIQEEAEQKKAAKEAALKLEKQKAAQRAENLENLYDDKLQFLGSNNKHEDLADSTPSSRFSLENIDSIISLDKLAILIVCVLIVILLVGMMLTYHSSRVKFNSEIQNRSISESIQFDEENPQ